MQTSTYKLLYSPSVVTEMTLPTCCTGLFNKSRESFPSVRQFMV